MSHWKVETVKKLKKLKKNGSTFCSCSSKYYNCGNPETPVPVTGKIVPFIQNNSDNNSDEDLYKKSNSVDKTTQGIIDDLVMITENDNVE